jgi:hypothetical protein
LIIAALTTVFAAAAILLLILTEPTVWRLRRLFPAVSWIPLGIGLVPALVPKAMQATLSYALILSIEAASGIGLGLFLLGARLCIAAKRRSSPRGGLIAATALAVFPFLVALIFILTRMVLRGAHV